MLVPMYPKTLSPPRKYQVFSSTYCTAAKAYNSVVLRAPEVDLQGHTQHSLTLDQIGYLGRLRKLNA